MKPTNWVSRTPFILAGLVTIGMVGWALINSPTVKTRLRESAQRARERMAERRTAWDLDDDTHAFDAAKTAGVKPSAYNDYSRRRTARSPSHRRPLPEGLGADRQTRSIPKDTPARA